MRSVTAETHTWLAARCFLLDRCDDFYLQLTRARESFDPEAIHDLRVSSRRLREGISIFSGCFRKRQLAPIRKELKSLTAMLGSIRNTDEALLFFSPLTDKCDSSSVATVMNIIATLQEERVEEQRRLKRELKKIDPGSLLGKIDDICSNPRIFNPATEALFRPVVASILAAVAVREKTMQELLPEAVVEKNITAQHRLRISVKRFRYRMEFLAPFAKGNYKGVYSIIKEYQELLGHMHDLDVFIGLANGPINEPQAGNSLRNIIIGRRRMLFHEYLRLHKSNPLDKMGDLVRGLL
jgi:CHAD domain-containing protein